MAKTVAPLRYKPAGPALTKFHLSNSFVRALVGPYGSGKTTACCMEIFRRAAEQKPNAKGLRRTRWLVIRRTYPELHKTTIKSWREIFGDQFGEFSLKEPCTHYIKIPNALGGKSDGTTIECEVVFMALDGPGAELNIAGSEWTGGWVNEAKEVAKPIIDTLVGRVGRFPRRNDGDGPTWHGIIMDTNAPDDDSWLYNLAEVEKPATWEFFRQPGGVIFDPEARAWIPNPSADNLANLPPNYYANQIAGLAEDKIRVNLANEYGFVRDGRPVFPEFVDTVHTTDLTPARGLPLYIGADFGLTPAAVIAQVNAFGQVCILDEVICDGIGALRFGQALKDRLATTYAGFAVAGLWGDPAGTQRVQTDEQTVLQMLNRMGLKFVPAPTNNRMLLRREAVAKLLTTMVEGKPGFLIDRKARMLRAGLAGKYCYKRIQIAGERYSDVPDKNEYSHSADALQYLCIGLGKGRALLQGDDEMFRPRVLVGGRKPQVVTGSKFRQRIV